MSWDKLDFDRRNSLTDHYSSSTTQLNAKRECV